MDRNVPFDVIRPAIDVSLSARRAWIEISVWCTCFSAPYVALRKESVDRNILPTRSATTCGVALRKESVDRNHSWTGTRPSLLFVALRKESVDRNVCFALFASCVLVSLSARRAWIEICAG